MQSAKNQNHKKDPHLFAGNRPDHLNTQKRVFDIPILGAFARACLGRVEPGQVALGTPAVQPAAMRSRPVIVLTLFAASLLVASRLANAACTPATIPTGIQITWLFPANGGPPGTEVILRGVGFNHLPADTQAHFHDTDLFRGRAPITVVNDEEIRTTLPVDAVTSRPRLTVWQNCSTVGGGQGGILNTMAQAADPLPVNDLPIRPTDEHAVAVSDQEIHLVWCDVSSNEDGFRVYFFNTPVNKWETFELPADATFFNINGLVPSTRYQFYVNAWNRTGETLHLHVQQTGDIVAATTFPPQSGRGTVTATPLPGAANVLCDAYPSWLTAYFDQNADELIDGISGRGGLSFPYPKYYEIGLWLPSGYVLRDGDAYARGLGTTANLAVTAAFHCGVDTPVFISAHFVLYYDHDRLIVEGIRLLGGDLADPTGGNSERRGVVMELEGFDGTIADDIERTLRAVGMAYGTISWVSPAGILYATQITFEFDAPVELR
jgi:hypothetical protein